MSPTTCAQASAILMVFASLGCTVQTPRVRPDTGVVGIPYDPFDPVNQCGQRTVPSRRVPGALLIVFDQSGSMASEVSGGQTRWTMATRTVRNVLTRAPNELSSGLLLFPSSGNCRVPEAAQVSIAPLSSSRAPILSALDGEPDGGTTPLGDAVLRGYQILDSTTSRGGKGVLVVTDGEDSCGTRSDLEYVHTEAARRLRVDGTLTYVVGLQTDNGFLSQLAVQGGTRRNATCNAECGGITTATCQRDEDCTHGQTCGSFGFGPATTRSCACASDTQCPTGFTCPTVPPIPFITVPRTCSASAGLECCHYSAQTNNFEDELARALEAVTGRLTSTCVFDVPREAPDFDAALLNVGVTFESESRTVVTREGQNSTSPSTWHFTDSTQTSISIAGPVCDRLRAQAATVEVVLGCPSIIL